MKLWNKFKPYLLLAAAAAVIILPRLPRLGFYTTADEPLYLKTSASFYHTVKNGNYEQSPKGFHPGVTALWAGYGGFEVGYPDLVDRPKADIGDTGLIFTLLRKGTSVVEVLAYARLWMILGQTAVLLAGLWLLVRLVGFPAAVMGYLLLSFDPFFFGHSRILGVDGLMANLMLAAALAAANYWKQSQLRYAALAGVFTGLAALTKTPGLAMAGYFGGALAVIYLASVKRNRASFSLPGVWRQVLLPFGLFSAAALLVMYALWPAMWYDPRQLWQLLVFSIESIGGGHSTA
ncbi:MAG: glycosyltransferase family 39 protein, partial [Anaerolineae bacterium]|nr:glycosyltransferase family 39 protein [Anaerolineae bacterium]